MTNNGQKIFGRAPVDNVAAFHECYDIQGLAVPGCACSGPKSFLGKTGSTITDLGQILADSVEWRAKAIQDFYRIFWGRGIGKNETSFYRAAELLLHSEFTAHSDRGLRMLRRSSHHWFKERAYSIPPTSGYNRKWGALIAPTKIPRELFIGRTGVPPQRLRSTPCSICRFRAFCVPDRALLVPARISSSAGGFLAPCFHSIRYHRLVAGVPVDVSVSVVTLQPP